MIRSILALSLVLAPTLAAAAPPDARAQRVADVLAVLQSRSAPAAVFAPSFSLAVPPAQLAALVQQLEAQNGKLLAAEDFRADSPTSGRFTLRFERGSALATFAIEPAPPHRVTGLRIGVVVPDDDSPDKIAADFAALPGRAGFTITPLGGGTPILAAEADMQLAIGSIFKLWVLDALAEEVAAGGHYWDEVVRLGARSLPSGLTQDWPAQAPVTVETLATLMISLSDNTATDTLVRLMGREWVAARVRATGHSDPSRILPLLTTAESFALKMSPPPLREAYARADDATQAAMLERLDTARILAEADRTALDAGPVAIDSIEWFASPEDMVRVLDSLRRRRDPRVLQILGVASGMPADLRKRFAYVGYKGGSEVGVIAVAWLLRRPSGEWIAVTAGWNDPDAAVDEQRFAQLAQRLLRLTAPRE